mmetsp:Transcript_8200/g.24562  ORF Transcript_8200/g.24562 Transcript_8200/m.24562 type:complete len:144 (-) Transcript_8200:43-474(-)
MRFAIAVIISTAFALEPIRRRATAARRPFLASAAASLLPVLAAPSVATAKAEDAPVDLKSILGDVQDGIAAKEAAAAAEAKLQAELDAMSVTDRVRYQRKAAATANKARMDEAIRKISVYAGDQDAADAKPSRESIRNPPKAM